MNTAPIRKNNWGDSQLDTLELKLESIAESLYEIDRAIAALRTEKKILTTPHNEVD